MQDGEEETVRWFGAFRSEGKTTLPDAEVTPLAAAARSARHMAFVSLVLVFLIPGGSLGLVTVTGWQWLGPFVVLAFIFGPLIGLSMLMHYGPRAWRLHAVRPGVTVERFSGVTPLGGWDDTVTRRLHKKKLVTDGQHHALLVLPQTGVLLAVDDTHDARAVRGDITETAPLRPRSHLAHPLTPLERAELEGVIDRMHKLRVFWCFAAGWVLASIIRFFALPDAEMRAWFAHSGFIVWFGIAGVLLVLNQLLNTLRTRALRGEADGPLDHVVVRPQTGSHGAAHASPDVHFSGFPASGVIWQFDELPGPLRLQGGGLRSKASRLARRQA